MEIPDKNVIDWIKFSNEKLNIEAHPFYNDEKFWKDWEWIVVASDEYDRMVKCINRSDYDALFEQK